MNKKELDEKLKESGINPRAYYLGEGVPPDECYVLEKNYDKWLVYYAEKGSKSSTKVFSTETDACQHLYNCLSKDISAKTIKVYLDNEIQIDHLEKNSTGYCNKLNHLLQILSSEKTQLSPGFFAYSAFPGFDMLTNYVIYFQEQALNLDICEFILELRDFKQIEKFLSEIGYSQKIEEEKQYGLKWINRNVFTKKLMKNNSSGKVFLKLYIESLSQQ